MHFYRLSNSKNFSRTQIHKNKNATSEFFSTHCGKRNGGAGGENLADELNQFKAKGADCAH
jgi:hypothetical protein